MAKQVAPEYVVGRDRLFAQMWKAIERESGSNDNSALAILDCLRAMRNENPNLRMIFTGSSCHKPRSGDCNPNLIDSLSPLRG